MRPATPPPSEFNFAQHLIASNAGRPDKTALIDDAGSLEYGALADQIRRFAGGLQAMGLKREERVLLLMHDCSDWVVAFLGSLYAGVVPVAVNTLLTADDYAFMLRNSRAQAALVSGALLPALQSALDLAKTEVRQVVVSRPTGALAQGQFNMADLVAQNNPVLPAQTLADEPAFWLYSSGSTGQPKGTVHSQGNLYWTAELYGKGVLNLQESDTVFSAAKLFFAYGLGNALTFPLSVGATVVLRIVHPPQHGGQDGALTAATAAHAAEPKQTIMPDNPEARAFQEAVGFSDAVVHGDTIYLSGVVAAPMAGETDLAPAYERALRLCRNALRGARATELARSAFIAAADEAGMRQCSNPRKQMVSFLPRARSAVA